MLKLMLDYFNPPPPLPPREPEPEPRVGELRIVPVGVDGFGVERCVIKNEKSRHPYHSWERIYGHYIGDSLEKCEQFARHELEAEAKAAELDRAANEARIAHHKANPPRIVTLESLNGV